MSKVLGLGAGGNKGVIELIKNEVISRDSTLLLNSTLRDIPVEFHDISINIGGQRGGCGKEREVAKELTYASLKDGTLDKLDSLLDPDDETVYLVSSTEGGSGSGSIAIVAKYFKDIYDVNVHVIAFTGFEDDARGLINTVTFFEDLSEEYTVQAISNKKFLDEASGNRVKAQELANRELVRRMRILLGQTIVESENNIDETDLHKVRSTSGYLTVEYSTLDRNIKNKEQFNKVISSMIDASKSVDVLSPGAKRIAVILNVTDHTKEVIDFSFDVLKQKLGVPFEFYTHIQNEGDMEFINVISSGMKLPIDEISDIYEKYQENMSKVDREKDSFFDNIGKLNKGPIDEFNSAKRTTGPASIDKKKQFLDNAGIKDDSVAGSNVKNKKEQFINNY